MVRQNFSHGRSKSVVVEKKRSKRPMSMQEAVAAVPPELPTPPPSRKAARATRFAGGPKDPAGKQQQRNVLRQLSTDEVDARARALIEARKREEVERREREERERLRGRGSPRQAAIDAKTAAGRRRRAQKRKLLHAAGRIRPLPTPCRLRNPKKPAQSGGKTVG